MGGAFTLSKGIVNMIKGTQGNLFPKGSEGNPYSKNPRAEGARKKRQYQKDQAEKMKNKEQSANANRREWERLKKAGEVTGPYNDEYFNK